ncbi:peptide deformylase [Leptolyngbyaceae cyanobacterium JSC-12]|nr:peptide deformylase [Leptolyngbyaceae cyanobacterium JSC-12]
MTAEVLVEKKKLAKPPLEIHHLGDRVLRQSAKRVAKVDAEIKQIIREMLQTMYSADGIGLAAPQVAVQKQIIVVDIEPNEAAKPPLILINPTIIKSSRDLSVTQEGCLSIPGVYLDVKRPSEVEVSFKDETGRPQRLKATGLLACCIQHEIDHLNGVLFVDRVENALLLDQELKKQGFSSKAVQAIAS